MPAALQYPLLLDSFDSWLRILEQLMPQQLQKQKSGHRGFAAPNAPKGKGNGSLMTRPRFDEVLQDMMTPMGLHSLSDVQQYRKLVEMRSQDLMNKREDEILRQYQHVTQEVTDADRGGRSVHVS